MPQRLLMYQVDAFAEALFAGNPAAVVPLDAWIDDALMQAIAAENNLSETAFFVPAPGAAGVYDLRWFTPAAEVELCGHATLASGHVALTELLRGAESVTFRTKSGPLGVALADEGRYAMDFPALAAAPLDKAHIADMLGEVLGHRPQALLASVNLMAVYDHPADLRDLAYSPVLASVLDEAGFWGLICTAPGEPDTDYDFLSRFFAPAKGVPEDPVTGSAHCALAPYWAGRLGKRELTGFQASTRGGVVGCVVDEHTPPRRVGLIGQCVNYLTGTITV
jgi:PhzF family phenazine biosynthesis protein